MRIRQFLFLLLLACASLALPAFAEGAPSSDSEFAAKLVERLSRTEKSIKLLRSQIVESPNAPFLAELYLQLGDLLSEKSNTLYYIQMEKNKASGITSKDANALSPIVASQKEAIDVFKLLLKDFPKFNKKPEVLFRLAVSYKSIDENAPFVVYATDLLKQYPNTDEAMKTRLLIGQHYFDNHDYPVALKHFEPLTKIKFPYERNLAKYRIGLIRLMQEKYKDSLTMFEEVLTDNEFKEQENPTTISATDHGRKSDLKREALIDSIRAYTHVYEKDADPVTYYSKLAPTESLFQEVIEKLSLRYITLKKYSQSVKLLRVLSERLTDPQKVITTYQNVLMMIPPPERINIPVEEMHFLLNTYNLWTHSFELAPSVKTTAFQFFEKQVRDLGTTAHDLAKTTKDAPRKKRLLERARDYYLLYLGFFDHSTNAPKMATNLADVYFLLGDYLHSGDYYLRVYHDEYGKAPNAQLLVENALLCLDKKMPELGYYENIRFNGLKLNAIEAYIKIKPSAANDPKIRFSKIKAEYDQAFFPESLESLFEFAKQFPNSKDATNAGDMILDYFNTRNEFGKLYLWSNRLLKLNIPNAAFNDRVKKINLSAKAKAIQEKVKSVSGYDEFSQGKSYLAAALNSDNQALASETLKQALAKSKSERDIDTFLQAAGIMADKEDDFLKKHSIVRSMAVEQLRVTRFYAAASTFLGIYKNEKLRQQDRAAAFDEMVNIALLLRDWSLLDKLLKLSQGSALPEDTRARLRQQFADLLVSGVRIPKSLVERFLQQGINDEILLAIFKARDNVSDSVAAMADREIRTRCGTESKQTFCRWGQLGASQKNIDQLQNTLNHAPATPEGIQKGAQEFLKVSTAIQNLEGSGDPYLETLVALKNRDLYNAFAEFLSNAADSNAALKQVLRQKAQETLASAKLYSDKCRMIGEKSSQIRSARFCVAGRTPKMSDMFAKRSFDPPSAPDSDPKDGKYSDLQRSIFAAKDSSDQLLQLARAYYDDNHIHHAAATAGYGLSLSKASGASFETLLGCSLIKLGLGDEAAYHLKKGESSGGLKEQCLKNLADQRGDQ